MTVFKNVVGILYGFHYIIIIIIIIIVLRSFGIYINSYSISIWKVLKYLNTIQYASLFRFHNNIFLIKRCVIDCDQYTYRCLNEYKYSSICDRIYRFLLYFPNQLWQYHFRHYQILPRTEQHAPNSTLKPDSLLFFKQLSCIVVSLGCMTGWVL